MTTVIDGAQIDEPKSKEEEEAYEDNFGEYSHDELRQMIRKDIVKSLVSLYVSDVDFTSVYPNVIRGCNIARDTLKSGVIGMGTEEHPVDVQDVCARAINTRENAVSLLSEHMNLPGYDDFAALMNEQFGEK